MIAFFDIDTQLDFVAPGGALYGKGSERLIPTIGALNRYAGTKGIPLISTTDAHPENADEFRVWPPHCVSGTFGQLKPSATLLAAKSVLPWDDRFNFSSLDLTSPQIVVEKNALDVFTNPHFPALLNALGVTECVVYGVFVDYCVKSALFGFLKSGRAASLVVDAADSISAEAGAQVLAEFRAAGGRIVTSMDAMGTTGV